MTGKEKCKKLKKIRKILADANGLEYNPSVCTFEGNCLGTCPKCEEELKVLSDELFRRVKEEGYHIKGFDLVSEELSADISKIDILSPWLTDGLVISCSSCGTLLSSKAHFCTNCGHKLPDISIVEPKETGKMIMGQMRYIPYDKKD